MASQTITLASSFTPKLATFNSPTPTLLPLPPPHNFSCSSSLATACLKASYRGVNVLRTSHFKCYASTTDGAAVLSDDETRIPILGGWVNIPDVEHQEHVQALGKFAVEEHNKKEGTDIKFIRVVEAECQVVAGVNYRLWIQGEVGKVDKVFKALVFVGRDNARVLMSFAPDEWE